LEHHATAAGRGLPIAIEHLGVEHVRRAENAVARQLELLILFLEFRGRSGIRHQESLSNANAALFLAACRTEPWPATGTVLDLLAARVTGENALARGDARGYIAHVEIPFAGYALQRGPAFSLPGTGSIG
jgi:hypothetical protein